MKKNRFKKLLPILFGSLYSTTLAYAQTPAYVDFDAYEKLMAEVKEHRKTRLLTTQEFKKMSTQEKVIVLDTRSDSMFAIAHIKGAVHLNFSDFTQANLNKIIPSPEYKILIYCNNNFNVTKVNPKVVDQELFATAMVTKAAAPRPIAVKALLETKPLTLALNIPTYINLYGYGFKNVYELSELVNTYDGIIEFEGTATRGIE